MSVNKIVNSGFGVGGAYGTPTTIGLAPTSTLSITSSLVGEYHALVSAGGFTGIKIQAVSTTNSVTGTYDLLNGSPGKVWLDGVSCNLVNTTTSVTILFLQT